jgi:hypothetical protein
MAEVKAELTYDIEITEDAKKTEINDLGAQIQRTIQEAAISSTSGVLQTTTTTERATTNSTGVIELNIPTSTTFTPSSTSMLGGTGNTVTSTTTNTRQ